MIYSHFCHSFLLSKKRSDLSMELVLALVELKFTTTQNGGQCVVVKVQTVFVILLQICPPPLSLVALAASSLGDDLRPRLLVKPVSSSGLPKIAAVTTSPITRTNPADIPAIRSTWQDIMDSVQLYTAQIYSLYQLRDFTNP